MLLFITIHLSYDNLIFVLNKNVLELNIYVLMQ